MNSKKHKGRKLLFHWNRSFFLLWQQYNILLLFCFQKYKRGEKVMYTKYQIAKAQNISLLDYIESRGYDLIYSHNEVRLKEHDSLVISNNKWK